MLDEEALAAAIRAEPTEALAMLADLTTATDERLRVAVQRVAARLVLDHCGRGRPRSRGVGRPRLRRADLGGDLDLDASIEAIAAARAEARPPALDELQARDWGRRELALAVLIDQSGSMNGERLAAAAVTAAACAMRAPGEHAVLAFARSVEVLKPMSSSAAPSETVERSLRLRGHGITGLATGLRAAHDQLASAQADRRVVILLSDCRATDEEDPLAAARAIDELLILAPAQDSEQAAALASASGARLGLLGELADVPELLTALLDG